MKYYEYIRNWISIENIATKPFTLLNRKFSRQFLDNSKFITKDGILNDPCMSISSQDCTKHSDINCTPYYSSREEKLICVNKFRIKNFEGSKLSQLINGKFGEIFKIIDTLPYTFQRDKRLGHTIYCHVLTHEKKGIVTLYILFNTGSILNANLLWDEPFTSSYLELLYKKYILLYKNSYQKVVLCGHSMGAVLALRLGYHVFVNDISVFTDKVLVIGSGPFKWFLKNQDKNYFNSNNIEIFLNASLYNSKWGVDPVINNILSVNQMQDETYQNQDDFIVYYPMIMIDNSKFNKTGVLKYSSLDETSDNYYSILGIDHSWNRYFTVIENYLEYKQYLDITWGVGIEHETMIFLEKKIIKKGSTIKKNLLPSIPNIEKNVETILEDNKNYSVLTDIEITHEIVDKVASRKTRKDLFQDQETLEILENWYLKYWNIPTNKKRYTTDKTEAYTELLYDITSDEAFSLDFTSQKTVIEFKTIDPKRQKIKQYIYQLKLQQDLIKKGIELTNQIELEFPSIGSVFPIRCGSQYCLDYTGSYHLNLSLPYSKKLLEKQKKTYGLKHNLIMEYLDEYLNEMENLDTSLDLQQINQDIKSYLSDELKNKPTTIEELNNINKKLDEMDYLINYYYQQHTGSNVDLSNYYFRLRYNEYHKLKQVFIYLFLGNNPFKIFSVEGNNLVSQDDENKLSIPIDTNMMEIIDIIKSVEINEYSKYIFMIKNRFLVKIPYKQIGQNFSKTVVDSASVKQISEIPQEKADFFLDSLNRASHVYFVNFYENIIKFTYYNLNKIFNLYFKYQSEFHHYHKILAIAIQIILPLVIGVYGSADPLSITGNQKLTQASLRTFISGYSFVNMCDILHYNIPDEKDILPYQDQPKSIKKFSDTFSYWDNKGYRSIRGSEFRVDPKHGFDFGFELRFFDNFPISDLENIVELFFLLADHLYRENIFENGFKDNPYDNEIVTNQLLEILSHGWNTKANTNYIRFLNENLHLELQNTQDENIFSILNTIYLYLQKKYIIEKQGYFSKYLISKRNDYSRLKNINRLSWEVNFKRLIWDPNTQFQEDILTLREKYQDHDEFIKHTKSFLTNYHTYNTSDVIYALESLGLISKDK